MNGSLITNGVRTKSSLVFTFPFSSHTLNFVVIKLDLGICGSLDKRLVVFEINTCSSRAHVPSHGWRLLEIELLIISHIITYRSV